MTKKKTSKTRNSSLNPNPFVQFLNKAPEDFTKGDIVKFVKAKEIKNLNLNYVGGDGRLKTLNFSIRDEEHLNHLLNLGERVDGSSLFKFIDPGNSDLYVIPRYKTAFVNPFTPIPTLNILCSYFDGNGQPVEVAPENIVKKTQEELKKKTGMELHALGELEYYVFLPPAAKEIFPPTPQRNYHESDPFVKCKFINEEAIFKLTELGIKVKYGHSEVGAFPLPDGTRLEQYEIELDLEPLEDMADHLVIAKWLLRNIAAKYDLEVTYAPKITIGHAGTGLHIHMATMKNSKNNFLDKDDKLSETAKKVIGGLIKLTPSLTAFGNTNPTSYLRLVPHQEAPTNICWGDKNRSVLVRVPLGWRNLENLSAKVNKGVKGTVSREGKNQTVELRCPDGSANVHLLLAGIGVAAKYGLIQGDESLKLAADTYVGVNIFKTEHKHIQEKLEQLPASCFESAERLKEHAHIYEEGGVFSQRIIEGVITQLKSFNDRTLNEELKNDKEKAEEYIKGFLHWG